MGDYQKCGGGGSGSDLPPLCPRCTDKDKRIASLERKIAKLQEKLKIWGEWSDRERKTPWKHDPPPKQEQIKAALLDIYRNIQKSNVVNYDAPDDAYDLTDILREIEAILPEETIE